MSRLRFRPDADAVWQWCPFTGGAGRKAFLDGLRERIDEIGLPPVAGNLPAEPPDTPPVASPAEPPPTVLLPGACIGRFCAVWVDEVSPKSTGRCGLPAELALPGEGFAR